VQWLYDIVYGMADSPESMQILVVAVAGLAASVLALGIIFITLGAADPLRRRLTHFRGTESFADGRKAFSIETLLGPVTQYVLPTEELERSKVIARLTYAGFRAPNALQVFYSIKAVLVILLPALTFIVLQFYPQVEMQMAFIYAMGAAAIGLIGPSYVLDKCIERRLKKLRDGFPDALDLLVVCVESGLGLTQALQRVADELAVSHPELALELAVVNAEIRAGVDRMKALKNLGDRTGLDDIKGLVSLLVQALKFGTGVADSLRIYSEEFRDKRMQKAEETAAKIGTKMIFPLVLFMFPGFFIVAVGPGVIRMMSAFGQLGGAP
jgi:tight adherence protein C